MYDLIVIGAGPAGASAAIHTSRAGLRVLMLYKDKPLWTSADRIQNYWGFSRDMTGAELFTASINEVAKFGAEIKKEEAISVSRVGDEFVVSTGSSEYRSKSIVLATGVSIKRSGISGEKDFEGKGVHYCVECDGFFYKNKRVAVIGNGDFAAGAAMKLTRWTPNVTIWTNGLPENISVSMRKKLEEAQINVRTEKIIKYSGERFLKALMLEDEMVAVDGVFVSIGTASSSDFARNLGLETKEGRIITDDYRRTAIPGVFAAGDCSSEIRQLAIAGGQGTIAGLAAIAYIRGDKKVIQQWSGK